MNEIVEKNEVPDETTFYQQLGFKVNPFQYTNADQEEGLKEYFLPPPYFQSVWGDPTRASSCVVFAPRGGGKSAQRKMIEARSLTSKALALQYTRFEFESAQSLSQVDLNYHIRNIVRICLMGLLMQIYEKGLGDLNFTSTEREHIKALARFYLYDMNSEQVVNAVNAIMGPFGRVKEYISSNLYAINGLIDGLLSKAGLSAISGGMGGGVGKIEKPSKHHLEVVVSLINSLGFDSVYILVDKVDETNLTGNDAKASFDLLESLLRDLEILQIKNLAFKFFLWNEIYPFYKKYARADRILQYHLTWKSDELKKMLQLRLQAYSSNRVRDFSQLLASDMSGGAKEAVESLLLTFSHGSPRDLIRICGQMVTEQLRLDPHSNRISLNAITEGFNRFCKDRAKEVVSDNILRDLQKLHKLDFTVTSVVNVAKIQANGARAKIKTWLYTGVVKYINDIRESGAKKPVHHYTIVDSRIAKSIFSELDFLGFLRNKVRTCPRCKVEMFRDWDISTKHICHECKSQFD